MLTGARSDLSKMTKQFKLKTLGYKMSEFKVKTKTSVLDSSDDDLISSNGN